MRREDDSIAYEPVVQAFHVCTKGLEDRMAFIDASDYQYAVKIIAVAAFCNEVTIIAYCIMGNHVHFLLLAKKQERAKSFIERFKKEYSRYFSRRYSAKKIFRNLGASIKEICEVPYMRNCVAYILRNPVEGGLVKDAGQYKWSSMECYFSKWPDCSFRRVSSLKVKEQKLMLCTHCKLSGSGLLVDSDYNILPQSFVDSKFVEKLFNYSQEFFWNRISKVNSAQMEYDLALNCCVRHNDYEMLVNIEEIIRKYFDKVSLTQLNLREKSLLVTHMSRYFKVGVPQIARLLGLDRKTVSSLLGR